MYQIENKNKQYFNKYLANKAIGLIDSDPIEAKEQLENYLKDYPQDYTTYPYYANVLITLGYFNEAEKVLNFVENTAFQDKIFTKDVRRKKYLRDYIIFYKSNLYIFQKKYSELYNLLLQEDDIEGLDKTKILFYCRKKLGLLNTKTRDTHRYIFRQMIEYKENDFKEHVKKHMADYQNPDDLNPFVFRADFPIDNVIEEIKKYIPSEKAFYNNFYTNNYFFKYNNCGTENHKNADFIKVPCFHESREFITMLPIKDGENLPYVDLNYMQKKTEKPLTRSLTPLEKFKLKYNLK